MASVKEHLHQHHTATTDFHKAAAAQHGELAAQHEVCAAEGDGKVAKCHSAMASAHKVLSKLHGDHAAHHQELLDKIQAMSEKTAHVADLSKNDPSALVPTQVSKIAPPAPGIRAVPRAGQPSMPSTVTVPEEFSKVFAIDEEIAFG